MPALNLLTIIIHTFLLLLRPTTGVKQLLRIVLIMDFTNESFLSNCESNPAIYKQCFFLWMDVWSSNTLTAIPSLIIEKYAKVFHAPFAVIVVFDGSNFMSGTIRPKRRSSRWL